MMKFRKRGLIFLERQVIYSHLLLISLFFMHVMHNRLPFTIAPALFLIAFILNFFLEDKYIVMSENEFSCYKGKKKLWEIEWSEVEKLSFSKRFHNTSVEVSLENEEMHWDIDIDLQCLYFQYSPKCKRAIKRYYKGIIQ